MAVRHALSTAGEEHNIYFCAGCLDSWPCEPAYDALRGAVAEMVVLAEQVHDTEVAKVGRRALDGYGDL